MTDTTETAASLRTKARRQQQDNAKHHLRAAGGAMALVGGSGLAINASERRFAAKAAAHKMAVNARTREKYFRGPSGQPSRPTDNEFARAKMLGRRYRRAGRVRAGTAGLAVAGAATMLHQGHKADKGDKEVRELRARANKLARAERPVSRRPVTKRDALGVEISKDEPPTAAALRESAKANRKQGSKHRLVAIGSGLASYGGLHGAVAARNKQAGVLADAFELQRRVGQRRNMATPEQLERAVALGRTHRLARAGKIAGLTTAAVATPVAWHQSAKANSLDAKARQQNWRARKMERAEQKATRVAKVDAFGVDREALFKADTPLPGDNPHAEAARRRRKAGLTVAGVGYLASSRTKDVAPGAADFLTRPQKALNRKGISPKARARIVDMRAAKMTRMGGKAGFVLVGTGIGGAAEGAVTDLRERDALRRTREQARVKLQAKKQERLTKSAFGVDHGDVGKAYQPGSITLHQEQADLHARKKGSAQRRMEGGLIAIPASAAVASAAHRVAPNIAEMVHGKSRVGDKVADRVKLIRQIRHGAKVGGVVGTAGGAMVATEGALSRVRHAHGQNKETKRAQQARKARNATLTKAFDSERARHGRQDMYASGATGGAILAGGAGVATGVAGRRAGAASHAEEQESKKAYRKARSNLSSMASSSKGTKPKTAANIKETQDHLARMMEHHDAAGNFATRAKRFHRISRASLAGAAVLGTGAYAAHDYDRRRGGRSYGY
jgi:hypothetical protein